MPPKSPKSWQGGKFNPLPKQLAKIYGLIAVLVVIIPELLAEVVLGISNSNLSGQKLNNELGWQRIPELQLGAMSLRELRLLAMQLKVHGYANENREALTRRLLSRMKSKIATSKRLTS